MDDKIKELNAEIKKLNDEINKKRFDRHVLEGQRTELKLKKFSSLIGSCFTDNEKCFMITNTPEALFMRTYGVNYNLNQIPAYILYIDKEDEDYGCLEKDNVYCRYTNEDGDIFELMKKEFKQITVEDFYKTIEEVSMDIIKKVREKNG